MNTQSSESDRGVGQPEAATNGAAAIQLNGMRVYRRGDVIFIPLPPELWRGALPVRCQCKTCKGRREFSFWDTLAVSAIACSRDYTWTVHAPELHPLYEAEYVEAVKQLQAATEVTVAKTEAAGSMPWCVRCQGYHHATAEHIGGAPPERRCNHSER